MVAAMGNREKWRYWLRMKPTVESGSSTWTLGLWFIGTMPVVVILLITTMVKTT
jgi:hypothetical protein